MIKVYVDRERVASNKMAYKAGAMDRYKPPLKMHTRTGTAYASAISIKVDGKVVARFVSDPSSGGCATVWVEISDENVEIETT